EVRRKVACIASAVYSRKAITRWKVVSQMPNDPLMLNLSSGRRVAISHYGDLKGKPVFFCHGWPSSRTMAELTNEAACDLGLHIISLDRPGIRDSSLHLERQLLDWPALLAETADQMSIAKFWILGISGGAHYALASAWAIPTRVRAIAVVSG